MKKIDIGFFVALIGVITLILGIVFNIIWIFVLGLFVFFGGCIFDYKYDVYVHQLSNIVDDSYDSVCDSILDS